MSISMSEILSIKSKAQVKIKAHLDRLKNDEFLSARELKSTAKVCGDTLEKFKNSTEAEGYCTIVMGKRYFGNRSSIKKLIGATSGATNAKS